jgi:hypothetical protein
MAAFSDNKYDVYNWIIDIAKSCQSVQHIRVVNKLVSQFLKQYDDWTLYHQLCDVTDRCSSKVVKTYLENKK